MYIQNIESYINNISNKSTKKIILNIYNFSCKLLMKISQLTQRGFKRVEICSGLSTLMHISRLT